MASSTMTTTGLEVESSGFQVKEVGSLTRSSPKADTVKLRMIAARQVDARFMIGKLKW